MSSREYDDGPQGEDRYGYHWGSWMYLIKTSWETIQIEAPYRPHDDPIVTFPPSPVRLYVMGPDETEVAEDLGVQTERSVYLTCTQDEEMGPGPPTALSRGPSTTLSLGTSTTQDEPSPQRYPTGKAIEWESEPSDDEENTRQRFRRKEPTPAPTFSGRGPDAEVIAHNSHPQTTPTSSPSDTLMGISPTTLNLLLEETLPEMENRHPSGTRARSSTHSPKRQLRTRVA